MRTLLLTGATLALLAGSMPAQAADIYESAPGYGAASPPAYQPVPGFAEAPPPAYAPLDPPYAYPPPLRYGYGPPGYGPQPGYVYSGPPVAYDEEVEVLPPARSYRGAPVYAERPYHCWWQWDRQVCAPRRAR